MGNLQEQHAEQTIMSPLNEAITNITEGSTTALKFPSFPYMVMVYSILDGTATLCAGTILSKRWVLTAAHCVAKNILVDFGIDAFDITQGFSRLIVFILINEFGIGHNLLRDFSSVLMIPTQTFIHPQYERANNDIALLYMPQDIPFSNNIQPVKLAYYESFTYYESKYAYVVGWKLDRLEKENNTANKSTTVKLKYATLPIIENNICRQYWPINDNHICTFAGFGQFACPEGNSSDPLIVRKNGQDFQIGIMTYGDPGDQSCPSKKPHLFTKLECAARDGSPTRSEIQRRLGASLAQVLLDYSHQDAVKLLDSLPLTKLSQQSCCATQDGQLKADAMGMWTKEHEVLKSHLHSDILALGEGELKKFQAEIEAATQRKLRDEFAEERHMLEAEKRFAVRRNADEIHARYEEYFRFAQQELEEKLQVELRDTDEKRNKELQKAIVKARIDTTHDVLRKIRPQINLIVTSLYNEFEQIHRAQREKMIADFNKIMRKQYLKQDVRIREIEKKKMEELHVQRRELEIQNVMNIIYIFCMEKLRCSSQLQAVQKHFENKMLQEKIDALTKEFQKFINFAFNTLPEHADFLLPLDLLSVNSPNKENTKQERSINHLESRNVPELFGPIKGRALGLQSQFHKLSSALYTPGRTVSLSQVLQRTMARLSYVVLIIAMNVLMCVLAEEETYPQKYAEFDVQEMFGEAIQTDCKKCADGHKAILTQVRDYWLKNQPEVWQKIVVKSKDYVKKN
ncbi:hypothetical protein DBV15_00868 [Temnothorax longispinosus]|uniref:Peptidase S1 domain-containing protein n=1 Tax=Temnothorax longispinosus TaxID=300112 RepID=A0A4S2KKU6_9HYME|nr:hypothetical protein DBV15_00868 [Temnothorax longispinosus]